MTSKIWTENTKSQKVNIVKILRSGGVGIMPTDTIYGVVGQALNKKTVERIYTARKKNAE